MAWWLGSQAFTAVAHFSPWSGNRSCTSYGATKRKKVLLTYNSTHPFKVYKSMASDPFTELYSHHHSQFENIFIMT